MIGGRFSLENLKNALTGKGTRGLFGVRSRSNYFDDPAVLSALNEGLQGQLDDRIAQANAGYGLPGTAGAALGFLGRSNLNNIRDALAKGGRPVFDENGKLAGAYTEGPFGTEVYTGNPVAGMPETGYIDPLADDGGEDASVVPPNPLTGVCPEGYIFDDDLQACRLDTGSATDASGPTTTAADGLMYRPTALDQAPAFGGDGFADANRQFVESFAYNPDFYENQMELTGFAPVRGLLG